MTVPELRGCECQSPAHQLLVGHSVCVCVWLWSLGNYYCIPLPCVSCCRLLCYHCPLNSLSPSLFLFHSPLPLSLSLFLSLSLPLFLLTLSVSLSLSLSLPLSTAPLLTHTPCLLLIPSLSILHALPLSLSSLSLSLSPEKSAGCQT